MDQSSKFNIFFMQIISGFGVLFISDWLAIKIPKMEIGIPMGMWIIVLSPVTFVVVWIIEEIYSKKP